MGAFGLCQLHSFVDYLRSRMTKEDFDALFRAMVIATASVTGVVGGALTLTGKISIVPCFILESYEKYRFFLCNLEQEYLSEFFYRLRLIKKLRIFG